MFNRLLMSSDLRWNPRICLRKQSMLFYIWMVVCYIVPILILPTNMTKSGSTSEYCTGCQPLFGNCPGSVAASTPVKSSTTTTTTAAKTTTATTPASTKISTDGTCGSAKGLSCPGTQCCSQYGWW
jgi:hypothetical protein